MKIKEFEFENLMKHRHTLVDCTQFQSAVIIGQTNNNLRKSMAVGKTTIFKGIEYGFFNFAPFNMEKIVRHGAEKCKVRIDFEVNSGTYRVIRARTKKGKADLRLFKFELDDWQDITQKTAKETEAELSNIIGISHGAWRASILFAQANLHGLASVTPRERKAILKEPLQILIYNEFEKLAKKRTAAAQKAVERTRVLVESLGNPALKISELEIKLLQKLNDLKSDTEKQTEIQTSLDGVKARLAKLQIEGSLGVNEIKSSISQISLEKEKLTRTLSDNEIILKQNLSKETSLDSEIKSLSKFIEDFELKEFNPPTFRTKEDISQEILKLSNKEIEGIGNINSLKAQKVKLSKTIPDQDLCELCRQPVSKEHRDNCESKRISDLETTDSVIEKTQKILEAIRAKKSNIQSELSQLEVFEREKLKAENTLQQKKLELSHSKKTIELISQAIVNKSNEISSSKKQIQEIDSQISDLNYKLSLVKDNPKEQYENQILLLNNDLKNITQKITQIHVEIGSIKQFHSTLQTDKENLELYTAQLREQEKQYSLSLKAQQVFSPAGVPAWIINTILDDLQIEANKILSEIHPSIEINFSLVKTRADGNLEDTLDIFYRVDGVEHEYEQLSGGQKVIVALTLKMAMSHIIQHRIGVDIKILQLDEVDSQFDDEGLDAFIDIIRKWQSKLTIFVITHNPYVKSKFAHAILVENDEQNGSVGKLIFN